MDALQKLEDVLQEREEFACKIEIERAAVPSCETDEELAELCKLASDVPGLWHHPAVTHQERKELLRCVIDHIVIAATKEEIDATIVWKTGDKTPIHIWRNNGRYNLVRELHAQGLTIFDMQRRLASGATFNEQVFNITVGGLYTILRKLCLKPNRFSPGYLALREKALELNQSGQSIDWIAEHFNAQGFKSASGEPWTRDMVYGLIRAMGQRANLLENIHRDAITEARGRGLNYRQMAIEFNERKIRRRDGQRWTARDIKNRWAALNQLRNNRQKAEKPLTALEST